MTKSWRAGSYAPLKHSLLLLFFCAFLAQNSLTGKGLKQQDITPTGVTLSGELKRWHKITLNCTGPTTSETATPNPFTNYRLDITFTHSDGKTYVVPGYYAACADPENGCISGNIWKVHFAPDRTGLWSYSISFKTGNAVATNGGGSSAGFVDTKTGTITVLESDKTPVDNRATSKGRLQYVGQHYLQYTGNGGNLPNGKFFIKAGPDSPENMLNYNDIDGTPNNGNREKSWAPHQQDYNAADAAAYTWNGGKGSELLGAINYLAGKGVNSFSFLTFSLAGDDKNVFPHLLKVPESTYNGYGNADEWNLGVYKDRMDVSKLAQWEKIFEYGDKKGMYLHFKTFETENDKLMDAGTNGPERKLYYRELIARFGHHLALNWNIAEEVTLSSTAVKSIASYIKSTDPYDHHIVLHTIPYQWDQMYNPLLGSQSEVTGASLQLDDPNAIHMRVKDWVNKSSVAGKKWVCANDEQGPPSIGINNDPNDRTFVRSKVLWGTLLAGGAGVEYYYGYSTGQNDLSAQDHRSRDQKYTDAKIAIDFFGNHFQQYLPAITNKDEITSSTTDYVLSGGNGSAYAVYLPTGGTTQISLTGSGWKVQWYNPRTGGALTPATAITNSITAPDNSNDWVALVSKTGIINPNQPPVVNFITPAQGATFVQPASFKVEVSATDPDGSIGNVKLYLNGTFIRQETLAPFEWNNTSQDPALQNLSAGTYVLRAVAIDNSGTESSKEIQVTITNGQPTDCAGIPGGTAAFDACGICAGGTTGRTPTSPKIWYADADGDNLGDPNNTQSSCTQPTGFVSVAGDLCPNDPSKANPLNCGCGVAEGTCGGSIPVVNFTKPSTAQNFPTGTSLVVNVTATDADGIANVKLYLNNVFVRQELVSPYDWNHTGQDVALQNLTSGTYVLRAEATDNTGTIGQSSITVTIGNTDPQTPYLGTPVSIPGILEAENYDNGGEGIAYSDANAANNGGVYRTDGVDLDNVPTGGYALGWTATGEWVEYTVNVTNAGYYNFSFTYSSFVAGAKIGMSAGGTSLFTNLSLPLTSGWGDYKVITQSSVLLPAGKSVLRMNIESAGLNIDKISIQAGNVPSNAKILQDLSTEAKLSNPEQVIIYPNPNSDGIFHLTTAASWMLYNAQGVELKKGLSDTIQLTGGPKGIYLIKVNGTTERIILE